MLRPLFDIRIKTDKGTILIDRIHSIDIESDWQKMTDTGILKLPRKAIVSDTQRKLLDLITTGCRIVVRLGYMGSNIQYSERMVTEFIGYIAASPQPFAPVEIQLEDEMFALKRWPVAGKTFTNYSKLADIVNYAIAGMPGNYVIDVADVQLSKNFVVKKGSASQVLQQIEEAYHMKSFFRLVPDPSTINGARQVLCVGKYYNTKDLLTLNPSDDILLEYRKNIIKPDVKYFSKNDKRIRVKMHVKMDGKAKDYEIETGDPVADKDGVVIQMKQKNIPFATAKAMIEMEYLRAKVDRFTGELTCFGFPFVRHGRIIQYTDWRFGDTASGTRYFVDSVKISSGVNGYRRTIHLGWLATTNNQNGTLVAGMTKIV